ncbi:MAG: hypothetical protein ABSF76_16160, partial [Opitutaceae bacterium]
MDAYIDRSQHLGSLFFEKPSPEFRTLLGGKVLNSLLNFHKLGHTVTVAHSFCLSISFCVLGR